MTTYDIISEGLDPLYFDWLLELVEVDRHRELCRIMFEKEFLVVVEMDHNRVSDALQMRQEFIEETADIVEGLDLYMNKPVSVLEILVVLSVKMCDITGEPEKSCFDIMISNLDLYRYGDEYAFSGRELYEIDKILTDFVNRNITKKGHGGIFPLKKGRKDQTKRELWYQMHDYLTENF